MGLIGKEINESSAVDVIRLDILMQYYPKFGCGIAGLKWTDPLGGGPLIQAHLVALLYGHILHLHHETRAELFARVGELAKQNVITKGATGFEFKPWILLAGMGEKTQQLWPWQIVPPEQVTAPETCSAILKLSEPTAKIPSGRWIEFEMAAGSERVFAPASALIAIAGFSQACDPVARYLLARLLWQMNLFWGSPNMVPLFSEAVAYAAAHSAVRSGPFHIP
jgi:hypothetical protein